MRGPRRSTPSGTAKGAIATTCADARRTRVSSTSTTATIVVRIRSRATARSSAWTRGLAWAMCGFAEQLRIVRHAGSAIRCGDQGHHGKGGARHLRFLRRARPAGRHSILGYRRAGLAHLGDWRARPRHRSTITSPWIAPPRRSARRDSYGSGAGSRTTATGRPYSKVRHALRRAVPEHRPRAPRADSDSVYHRPNGWDAIPGRRQVPAGESSMWGDYHAREVALYLLRLIEEKPYLKFWVG